MPSEIDSEELQMSSEIHFCSSHGRGRRSCLGKVLEAENATEELIGIAKVLLGQLQIVQFNLNGSIQREAELKCSVIKVNTNVGYSRLARSANLGVVAGDPNGRIIFSAITRLDKIKDALWAEAAVVKYGLSLAMLKGVNQTSVETDSAITVKLLSKMRTYGGKGKR
ncbi:hypothetical protein DITRI_Ditri02bG0103800 [Diplodiscus trichospermus]